MMRAIPEALVPDTLIRSASMWIARICRGLLQVSRDSDSRYVKPSVWERLYLLWTFRNFRILPQEVLNQRQRKLVGRLCSRARQLKADDVDAAYVIGTVELYSLPPKKTAAREVPVLHPARPLPNCDQASRDRRLAAGGAGRARA
jgi:hypothetical protein